MKNCLLLSLLLLVTLTPAFAADDAVLGELPNMREPQQNRIVAGAIDAADLGRTLADRAQCDACGAVPIEHVAAYLDALETIKVIRRR